MTGLSVSAQTPSAGAPVSPIDQPIVVGAPEAPPPSPLATMPAPAPATPLLSPASGMVDAPSTVLGYKASHIERPLPEHPAPPGFPRFPTPHEQYQREEIERNTDCEEHTVKGKPCRVSWTRVIGESVMFLAAQHGGNIWMDDDTRYNLTHGSFWGDYIYCVDHYRWSRWKDDDPFGVDYIGHPMMGAITNSIYEQNDPKQRALMYENSKRYWFGRLRATAYSAAYSAQWKVGPASEASVGNTGIGYYIRARDGIWTNETGMQDFFITPIGGLAWNVGEDAIDRFLFRRALSAHRNKAILFAASFMTPLKSGANILRFRAPYYRDYDEKTSGIIHWKSMEPEDNIRPVDVRAIVH